ncbi:hypothetical protein MPC1_6990001 [Methylocella tundrae]|nr:hypothetical protein MPC1_6990001 [Methylocella tundrae]
MWNLFQRKRSSRAGTNVSTTSAIFVSCFIPIKDVLTIRACIFGHSLALQVAPAARIS